MKTIYKYISLLFYIGISTCIALAQTVTNVRVQQEGKQIIITYDLDKTAYVHVYVSIGDSEQYTLLKAVTGNVGKGVQPGTNRRITWTPLEECSKFAARDVCFRVESMPDVHLFWVSPTKAVIFSPGNLQYRASTNTWRFAPHQWEYIGEANKNISKTYNGWIDLFGWGTGNNPTKSSTNIQDYQTFVDWGINKIGNDVPNTWRTLTGDEWKYLFVHTHWTMARVNGVLGFMLLPDGFVIPKDMTLSILGNRSMLSAYKDLRKESYTSNVYTSEEFTRLETMGCVFLPCSGGRDGSNIYDVDTIGGYWSDTNDHYITIAALIMCAGLKGAGVGGSFDYCAVRYIGMSVRLVQEVSLEKYAEFTAQNVRFKVSAMPNVPFFWVSPTKAVIFSPGNLQYRASTNTWRFAPHQWEYIGETNKNISKTYDGWIDLFGWGTGDNPAKSSYHEEDYRTYVDWGINKIGDDVPNTWRTLTCDEWKYLFMHTRWTMARVNGVLGFMLLPDDFFTPAGWNIKMLGSGKMFDDELNYNEFDYAQNKYSTNVFAQLESKGCVFLPCAGCRSFSYNVRGVDSVGVYWSGYLRYGSNFPMYLSFLSTYAQARFGWDSSDGRSVRLVRDLK